MTASTLSLRQSIHEILENADGRLGGLFYRCLLEEYPELRGYFDRLDMSIQSTMLVNALHVVAAHAEHRRPATGEYLRILGHRHMLKQIPSERLSQV